MEQRFGRRGVLKLAAGSAAAALLAACGGGNAATNTPSGGGAKPTVLAGQTSAPSGTLAGGTGGQTPVAATAAPASTTVSGSAAAANTTRPVGSTVANATSPAVGTPVTNPITQVPLSPPNTTAKGNVRYWQTTYDTPSLPSAQYHEQWANSLKTTLPNVAFKEEQQGYNDMLDKLRVALKAGQGPDVAVLPLLWIPEFSAQGALAEINLQELGYSADKFWPGALKSVSWNGKLYGVPTNNETHGFIWNKAIFEKAGLDPEKPPATWEDVKNFSKQIKDKTGKPGYGIVAKLNAGDIPYRFMPLCWAHGGAALDETADSPKNDKSNFDNEGTIAALQWIYDVFVRDQSAPASAFTNTGVENQNLLLSGEIAMMSGHPTTYALAKKTAPDVAAKLGYTLMPMGPVRRAVVFGGSDAVIFKGAKDLDAAKAVVKDRTSPQWSLYHQWETSNPGNRDAFSLPDQQKRLAENTFLNVTTDNLQYGISFPAVPESSDIMNLMVPQMMQDVMTKNKTPQQAGQDTAKKVNDMLAKRK
ncbi:MAG: extracellular solute-binding protein [Chloroflexota bacterium]|nr:extracellular solute-binding protein [Chloroflexota bacterium]MDQ6905252.1 extracellular solute-binding protein [Chloroflexota bacterium]